jgi:hypothetical protein
MRIFAISAILVAGCTQPGAPAPAGGAGRGEGPFQDGGGGVVEGPATNNKPNEGAAGSNNSAGSSASGNSSSANSGNNQPAGSSGGSSQQASANQGGSSSGSQSSTGQGGTRPGGTVIATPTQSTSGGMCRRASFQAQSGLGLTAATEGEVFRPLTILVTINGNDSTCTGFLYNQKHGFGEIGADGKPVSSEVRYLMLPRISLAKHCMQIKNKIHTITFTMPEEQKAMSYAVNADGSTEDGPWHIDLESIKETNRQKDKCSLEQAAAKERKIACFTANLDRFEIISKVEAAAIKAKDANFALALKREELEKYAKQSILETFPSANPAAIQWAPLFENESAKFTVPLNYQYNMLLTPEDFAFAEFYPPSLDDLYAQLDQRLEKISVVSSIIDRRVSDQSIVEIVRKEGQSWRDILEFKTGSDARGIPLIYGDSNGVGFDRGRGQSVRYFQIESIGIKPENAKLGKGHSGTLLLGHWRRVSAPILSYYTYRQILGVLSTVGGDDVCTGDDLTCCEKVQ